MLFINLAFGFERQILPGHVPPAAKVAQRIGRLDANKKLRLAIGLPLRNRAALEELLKQLYNPSNTNFHQYLTPGEFTARFGPTEQDYLAEIDFARSNHLTIVATHPNRMLLDVSGSVADIEKAWGITLSLYQHPSQSRTFYAPESEPISPPGVPTLHISGLNNYQLPRPALRRASGSSTQPRPLGGSGHPAGTTFYGNDFRGAYARGSTLTGAGQMVGLLEFDGYYPADIDAYWSIGPLANVPIITVTTDGFDGSPGPNNIEVALDIEMVSSMAPGLSAIIVYEAGGDGLADDLISRMANDNLAKQLSSSWTFPTDIITDQLFLQLAAQGQSYFNASGDGGAYSGQVDTPADDPYITVVGGTTLTTTGPGGAWVSESSWNRGGTGMTLGSTGGGISGFYSIPGWQQPVTMTDNHGSTTMRNLPDVAAVADQVYVTYDNGQNENVGGTSCSSPLWAAFTALVNQQAANFGRAPVGFLNPALYTLGLSAGYGTNFHDVATGNNTNSLSPGNFFAVPGYDLCTGWGTPLGPALINALAPRVPSPLITNGTTTIFSEGCVPPNATLDPGETVTINFGLKNLGGLKTTNLVAELQSDQWVRWPSPPQTYGVLNSGGAAVSRTFTFTAYGDCGQPISPTFHLRDGDLDLGTLAFNFTIGKPVITLSENFDSVTPPALPSDWTTVASNGVSGWVSSTAASDTAPNGVFADEPPVLGIEELLSPMISIVSSNAQLTFRQNFNTEANPATPAEAYDGGLLEIKLGTNDFKDILDAGGSFSAGGYNRTLSTDTNSDNLLAGRSVWGGLSGGFISTVVNLPSSAAGQEVQFKWRFSVDTGNFYGGFGWYIDTVSVRDGTECCNPSADVSVAEVAAPEPVAPGASLTYTLTVTNAGPGAAYGVNVTNLLPETVVFSSGSPGCSYTNGMVLCDAGMLAGNSATNFSFEVIANTGEAITNSVLAGGYTPDPDPSNNQVTLVSTIDSNGPPVVYLAPRALVLQGGDAKLEAVAYGVAPLAYQWFFNESQISGETSAVLSLTNVIDNQAGRYFVQVTNVNGAVTSSVLQLLVVTKPTIHFQGSPSDGAYSFSFDSVVGLSYSLEYKDSLTDLSWTPLLPLTSGTGLSLTLSDTNSPAVPARFYRLSIQ